MKKQIFFITALGMLCANGFAQSNIFPSSGNAGVGTTNPSTSLQVVGNVAVDSSMAVGDSLAVGGKTRLQGDLIVTGNARIKGNLRAKDNFSVDSTARFRSKVVMDGKLRLKNLADTSLTDKRILAVKPNGVVTSFILVSPPPDFGCHHVLPWHTDNNLDVLLCTPFNRVGIGTSYIPSEAKLAVKGKIFAEEFEVQNASNWPDDILDENYHLMSWKKFNEFIKINKHFPFMPSRSEITISGQHIGAIQLT